MYVKFITLLSLIILIAAPSDRTTRRAKRIGTLKDTFDRLKRAFCFQYCSVMQGRYVGRHFMQKGLKYTLSLIWKSLITYPFPQNLVMLWLLEYFWPVFSFQFFNTGHHFQVRLYTSSGIGLQIVLQYLLFNVRDSQKFTSDIYICTFNTTLTRKDTVTMIKSWNSATLQEIQGRPAEGLQSSFKMQRLKLAGIRWKYIFLRHSTMLENEMSLNSTSSRLERFWRLVLVRPLTIFDRGARRCNYLY